MYLILTIKLPYLQENAETTEATEVTEVTTIMITNLIPYFIISLSKEIILLL